MYFAVQFPCLQWNTATIFNGRRLNVSLMYGIAGSAEGRKVFFAEG